MRCAPSTESCASLAVESDGGGGGGDASSGGGGVAQGRAYRPVGSLVTWLGVRGQGEGQC